MNNVSTNKNRIIQFDALRVIAAFAVVMLHTSAQRFYDCFNLSEWDTRNFYDSMVRWGVPIFIMISGALFLDSNKKIGIKSIYTKNITRILTFFVFWSIVYGVYGGLGQRGFMGLVGRIIHGPFHFWFLKMLIGLYICVPILRPIATNKKLDIYFICISLVTAFFIPMLFPILGYFSEEARSFTEKNYNEFGINIALGYVGYFVLGHKLAHTSFSKKNKITILTLGIMSAISVCFLTNIASKHYREPYLILYEYNNLFTLFEALAIFIIIKDINIPFRFRDFLTNASKTCLGIYIIHPLVMSFIYDSLKIDSASINPMYFIPVYAFLIFLICFFIVIVLIKIPVIKKIVV